MKEKMAASQDERSGWFILVYHIADGLKPIVRTCFNQRQFSCLLLAPILSFIFSTLFGQLSLWRKYCHS
jgi:hypothetical protein